MATHQILFAETVAGMKKALKRKAYESDSDDAIIRSGNRGQKLKKRARFTQEGQLAPPSGPEVYKENVEYAGVRRDIISRKPPLIDDDGYEVDSEDDDERAHDAVANAASLDPYADIRLERILSPLTAITELSTHPTLSKPFVAKTLTDLAIQSSEIMRKENRALWKVRHLMTGFCGDCTWIPCGKMLGPNDIDLYSDDYGARSLLQQRSTSDPRSASPATLNGDAKSDNQRDSANGEAADGPPTGSTSDKDVLMTDAKASPDDAIKEESGASPVEKPKSQETPAGPAENGTKEAEPTPEQAHDKVTASDAGPEPIGGDSNKRGEVESAKDDGADGDGGDETETQKVDGAEEAAPSTEVSRPNGAAEAPSTTPETETKTFIHPFFDQPPSARRDRDMGLPENEAENVRHLVTMYIQKQEEVCRGARKLCEGLLKADRLRRMVLKWSKSEAHCGANRDMSDGEDWYDKEEWGLDEDLKKGADEEEEETGPTAKKTRNRR